MWCTKIITEAQKMLCLFNDFAPQDGVISYYGNPMNYIHTAHRACSFFRRLSSDLDWKRMFGRILFAVCFTRIKSTYESFTDLTHGWTISRQFKAGLLSLCSSLLNTVFMYAWATWVCLFLIVNKEHIWIYENTFIYLFIYLCYRSKSYVPS